MKKKALKKDFHVEIKKSMNRFLSIFFIVALGVAFYAGIQASAPDMRETGDWYFDDSNLMDIRVQSTLGITEADLEAIRQVQGILAVTGSYSEDVYVGAEDSLAVLHVESIADGMNELAPQEGTLPEQAGECFLDMNYAQKQGYQVGDTLEIAVSDEEDTALLRREFTVAGIGYSPCYVSYNRGSTTLGTGSLAGFIYVLPEEFDSEIYMVAYALVEGAREQMTFTDGYDDLVAEVLERVEDIADARCQIRYDEVMEEANEKIADADQEIADGQKKVDDASQKLEEGKIEAESELAEAESELLDGEEELREGRRELRDAIKELSDAKKEIADGEEELADGEAQIADGEKEIADNEAVIEDAKRQIADAKDQLDSGEAQYSQGLEEFSTQAAEADEKLQAAQKEIDSGKEQVADGWFDYYVGLDQVQSGELQIEAARAELEQQEAQLNAGASELASARAQYEQQAAYLPQLQIQYESVQAQITQLTDTCSQLQAQADALEQAYSSASEGAAALRAQQQAAENNAAGYTAEKAAAEAAKSSLEQEKAAAQDTLASKQEAGEDTAEVEAQIADLESRIAAQADTISRLEGDIAAQTAAAQTAAAQAAEIEAGLAVQNAALQEVQSGLAQAQEGLAAAQAGEAQLKQQMDALTAAGETLAQKEAELAAGQQQIAAAKSTLDAQAAQLSDAKAQLEEAKATLESTEGTLASGQTEILEGYQELDDALAELEAARSELDSGWSQLKSSQSELADGERQLSDGRRELEDARQELADGRQELTDARQELSDGEAEVEDARIEVAESNQKIKYGWQDYYTGKQEADDQIREGEEKLEDARQELEDGRQELADAQKELADIKVPDWYVNDRSVLPEHTGFGENADRLSNIAKVVPILFFLVAALISLTTMTRMVEEQRTQIGTLKALGYSKLAIASKYLKYALAATLGGSVVGILIGEKLFPYVIITAYGIMFQYLPKLALPYNWTYALIASAAALFCTLGATVSACYRELMAVPAELMRPPAPKEGKRIWLERLPFLWRHMSFTWKSTARNLFRYKKRFLMTIIGIGGCMGLLLIGYGLQDSIMNIGVLQFDELHLYDAITILDTDEPLEEQNKPMELLQEDAHVTAAKRFYMQLEDVQTAGLSAKEWSIYVCVPEDTEELEQFISLRDRKTGETYQLTDEGAIITEKISNELGLKAGDTISLKQDDAENVEIYIQAVCENYLSHYLYMTPALYESIFGSLPEYNSIFWACDGERDMAENIGQGLLSEDVVLNITYTRDTAEQIENMLGAMDVVMIVIIISAGMLAFVVLYNLNNININERRRELATLKVLGFFDGEVAAYVYRENVLLTLLGAALGVLIGKFLHMYVITTVEVDSCMFGRNIDLPSFVYGALITIGFSMAVNGVMYFKLKKIDMVESLKSIE